MISHAPADYRCPFCRNLNEGKGDWPLEIVHLYDEVAVKLNIKWWRNNPGAVLVVPRAHYENVYDLPIELGTPMQEAIRDAAVAMKQAFDCDGVSQRQHNEPAGHQDVWHYHVHVFPRFEGDHLYQSRDT
ncbi:MAG: HIT family protein [Actinobacteria bacterium]|nr:HIT family protein [Actinomycetota bacterium]